MRLTKELLKEWHKFIKAKLTCKILQLILTYNMLSYFFLFLILIEDELLYLYLYFICVQVDGKLVILVSVLCFEEYMFKMSSFFFLISRDNRFYCYRCKSMVRLVSLTWISNKIKSDGGDQYDCVLCEP